MKLSKLAELVDRLKVHAGGEDVDVDFWIGRKEIKEVGEKESDFFVSVEIDDIENLTDHTIPTTDKRTRQQHGDLTLPLRKTNFYK